MAAISAQPILSRPPIRIVESMIRRLPEIPHLEVIVKIRNNHDFEATTPAPTEEKRRILLGLGLETKKYWFLTHHVVLLRPQKC